MPAGAGAMMGAVLIVLLLSAAIFLLQLQDRRWSAADSGTAGTEQPRPGGTSGRTDLQAPIMLELAGSMLEAGSSLEQTLTVLSTITGEQTGRGLTTVVSAMRLGAGWEQSWAAASNSESAPVLKELEEGLGFAAATGAPSSALLSAQAQQMRRRSYREAEQRAAALGVRLVLPMGLCSLPAFVCIGVLPVLLAMLPTLG
ncbi:type II secretion system F family protein [Arthrobacter sp. H14]|uniref:type II secretion system F family protein n=1 Tax=Arthrobacter sp. H14 TaxID=1312959 RepID=UPI0004ADA8BB|nr:type II secretion system F family protein [Arthrobacter sp. H14]